MKPNLPEYQRMNQTRLFRLIALEHENNTFECAAKSFAQACNCSEEHIRDIFNGKTSPALEEWIAIIKLTGTNHFENFILAKLESDHGKKSQSGS